MADVYWPSQKHTGARVIPCDCRSVATLMIAHRRLERFLPEHHSIVLKGFDRLALPSGRERSARRRGASFVAEIPIKLLYVKLVCVCVIYIPVLIWRYHRRYRCPVQCPCSTVHVPCKSNALLMYVPCMSCQDLCIVLRNSLVS